MEDFNAENIRPQADRLWRWSDLLAIYDLILLTLQFIKYWGQTWLQLTELPFRSRRKLKSYRYRIRSPIQIVEKSRVDGPDENSIGADKLDAGPIKFFLLTVGRNSAWPLLEPNWPSRSHRNRRQNEDQCSPAGYWLQPARQKPTTRDRLDESSDWYCRSYIIRDPDVARLLCRLINEPRAGQHTGPQRPVL